MYCMDSLQREVAGFSRPQAQHQPAFASDCETVFDDDFLAGAETMADAAERRDFEKAQLSAAWKGGLERGDRIRLGDRMVVVGDRNPDTGKIRLHDAEVESWEDAESIRQQMYDEYDAEISNAWRTDE